MGAKTVLGESNITFLSKADHTRLRTQLRPVFEKKALSVYLPIQERLIRRSLAEWCDLQKGRPFESRLKLRDLNVETSVTVFVGPYVTKEQIGQIADLFQMTNDGFISFPVYYRGSPLWKAEQARFRLTDIFSECARRCKTKFTETPDADPVCLLDVWMKSIVVKQSEDATADVCTVEEMGLHMLDFLFAAQDASTSVLVYVFAVLAERPDVLQKIVEEQMLHRPNDEPITYDMVESRLSYTRCVVRELLRTKSPATMVPHAANCDTSVGGHSVAKGTVLLPSIWEAHMHEEHFPNPTMFDPSRFDAEHLNESLKHWVPFGRGPHLCLGQNYAVANVCLFVSVLARNYDFERITKPGGDKIVFRPTIFPADGAIIKLFHKTSQQPTQAPAT